MDIFFSDPNEHLLPPEEVRIRQLSVTPYPDKRRVAMKFEITPFEKRPNMEFELHNQEDLKVASFSVVEAIENKMEFTLHLREAEPGGSYTATMRVFYVDLSSLDDEDGPPINQAIHQSRQIVDTRQIQFDI